MPAALIIAAIAFIFVSEGVVPTIGNHLLENEKFGTKAVQEIEYKLDTLGYNYDNIHSLKTDTYEFSLYGITEDGTKNVVYRAYEVMYKFDIDKNGHISNPAVYRKGRMTSTMRLAQSEEFSPEMIEKKKREKEERAKKQEVYLNVKRAIEYDEAYKKAHS